MKLTKTMIGLTAAAVGVTNAFAGIINPGTIQIAEAELTPGDGTLVTTLAAPFLGGIPGNEFSGSLVSTVFTGDASNHCKIMTFEYQLFNNLSSKSTLNRLTLECFAPYMVDVRTEDIGSATLWSFTREAVTGDVLGANIFFASPGSSSDIWVVHTDALAYSDIQGNVIDGATASVMALGPTCVPEPQTYGLLGGLGLLGLAGYRRFLS